MKKWQIDPLKHCLYYKNNGCSHVDGYLCDVLECNILNKYMKTFQRKDKLTKILNNIKYGRRK